MQANIMTYQVKVISVDLSLIIITFHINIVITLSTATSNHYRLLTIFLSPFVFLWSKLEATIFELLAFKIMYKKQCDA